MAKILTKLILLTGFSIMFINPKTFIHCQQVPCAFFFGDSQFDNGNNNMLATQAKANYQPYGIDYPDGPTGRFTNGENIPDFLAKFLGFPNPIPPYTTATNILQGVNYASGAAGILEESGSRLGDRFSMDRQLLHHGITMIRLATLVGPTRARDLLSKCLYTVNMGSNDYLNNFLLPQSYLSSRLFTPDQFSNMLIQRYSLQLRRLYRNGARKIAVFGLGLLGCVLQELDLFPLRNGSACVDFINGYAIQFNNKLVQLINNLNNDLPGASFTYINIFGISSGDPSAIGITVDNTPCCRPTRSDGQCVSGSVACNNRNQYVFFDKIHPTTLLNFVMAISSYNATSPSDASPVDIRHLVMQ